MHLYTSDVRHAWFHLHGTSGPARSASEATKYKMKNSLSTVGLKPSTLRFKVWCSTDWASRAWWMLSLNGFIAYMYSQYQCLPCYKYQYDEVERNLSHSQKCDPTRRKSCRTHLFFSKKQYVYFSEHRFCSVRQLTCLHHVQRIILTL